MKFLIPLALLSLASPANALTWKEFWEPFVEESHHDHRHYHGRRVCYDNVYRESRNPEGHIFYYYEQVRVSCYRKYHDPHRHYHHYYRDHIHRYD